MNLDDPFAARMRVQIRLIERYRQRVLSREGRQLDGDTAAFEWIARHAASFPSPERYAAHRLGAALQEMCPRLPAAGAEGLQASSGIVYPACRESPPMT